MICVNLFVTFISDVFNPFIGDGFMIGVNIILVDHEAEKIKEMHYDNEFDPFFIFLGGKVFEIRLELLFESTEFEEKDHRESQK